VLPVVLPVAGCTVATVSPLEKTTGDASPPSRVGVVADVGRLDDRSFNPSAWQGVLATAQTLGLTADEDCRCVETTDPEDYTQHIGEFVDSGSDVIVTAGLALGNATVAAAPNHPDSASPEWQQLLTAMQIGFDSDMLAMGHEQ
jgi:basic membrane protein A